MRSQSEASLKLVGFNFNFGVNEPLIVQVRIYSSVSTRSRSNTQQIQHMSTRTNINGQPYKEIGGEDTDFFHIKQGKPMSMLVSIYRDICRII